MWSRTVLRLETISCRVDYVFVGSDGWMGIVLSRLRCQRKKDVSMVIKEVIEKGYGRWCFLEDHGLELQGFDVKFMVDILLQDDG